jgi:large subunit ribosomal protein L9
MKVILLENVEKLGKKYDVKEVKDGYARNYLFTKGLAKIADKNSLKWAEEQRSMAEKAAEQELIKTGEMASRLDDMEIEIPVKVGEQGQLFEKINAQKIAKHLQEMGYDVKKNQVVLEKDIEEPGEFEITLKFEHNLEAKIKAIVNAIEQKEKKEEEI